MKSEMVVRQRLPQDFEDVYEIFQQPKVIWGTLQMPYPSYHLWKERFEKDVPGMTHFVAVVDDKVVGSASIGVKNRPRNKHVASIGMAVHDAYHGRGIGTALMQAIVDFADNWLNVVRIELEVDTDNPPAIGLYKRFGFEIEGVSRMSVFREGEYIDTYYMSRLREPRAPRYAPEHL